MAEDKRLEQPLSSAEIEKLRELRIAAQDYAGDEWSAPRDYADCDGGWDGCTVEIEAEKNKFICAAFNALPRLLAMLETPTDAAVREAVEQLEADAKWLTECCLGRDVGREIRCGQHIRTLLSLLRAAQLPRLTDAQAAALHIAYLRCKDEGSLTDVVEILESTFPGVFGKE